VTSTSSFPDGADEDASASDDPPAERLGGRERDLLVTILGEAFVARRCHRAGRASAVLIRGPNSSLTFLTSTSAGVVLSPLH